MNRDFKQNKTNKYLWGFYSVDHVIRFLNRSIIDIENIYVDTYLQY